MANGVLHRNRLAASSLVAVFGLLLGIETAVAALLKDIRVGRYDQFTRIVFELDTFPGDHNIILSENPGRLTVDFVNTRPALVRKIPIERAQSIQDLRIRTHERRLSLFFDFIYRHDSVKRSFIDDPPRLILDVHLNPESNPAPVNHAQALSSPVAAAEQTSNDLVADAAFREASPSARRFIFPHSSVMPARETVQASGSKHLQASIEVPPDRVITSSGPDHVQARTRSVAVSALSPLRRQYYLIIGLIVITAVILILVLVMLLSRKAWDSDAHLLNTKEYLKRQDDRIALLDARIKEQLERYQKA